MRVLSLTPFSLFVVLVLLLVMPESTPPAAQTDLSTPLVEAAPPVEDAGAEAMDLVTYNNPWLNANRVGTDGTRSDAYVAGCFCFVNGHSGNAHSWIKQGGTYPGFYVTFDPDQVTRNGQHGLFQRIVCDTDFPE